MTTLWLLVHSPLLGPSSLEPLAKVLTAVGGTVALPDLTPCTEADIPDVRYRELARNAGRKLSARHGDDPDIDVVVLGHSGAGPHLPEISAGVGVQPILAFVDAAVPPTSRAYRTPSNIEVLLDKQTVDGRLRPWLDWWPTEVVADLLPDPEDRARLAIDLPRLPRSFHRGEIPVPDGWSSRHCLFLRLSEAYDAELAEATRRGWPTATLDSTHLGPFVEPERVAAALADLRRYAR